MRTPNQVRASFSLFGISFIFDEFYNLVFVCWPTRAVGIRVCERKYSVLAALTV
jgi:hypothetical protein